MDVSQLIYDSATKEVLYLTVGFLFVKHRLRKFADKGKGAFKKWIVAYNVGMAVFSFAIFVMCAMSVPHVPLFTGDCKLLFSNNVFRLAATLFYYSKYVEFMDTFWLVLKGRRVSILQTFHHFGAPWNMWLIVQYQSEPGWIFVTLNSFIHTIMYSYYTASSLGARVSLKIVITSLQITQFITGFVLLWEYKSIPCFAEHAGLMASFWYSYGYVGVVFLLFVNYFVREYVMKLNKRRMAAQLKKKE